MLFAGGLPSLKGSLVVIVSASLFSLLFAVFISFWCTVLPDKLLLLLVCHASHNTSFF